MKNIMDKNELIKILEDWNFWKKDLKIGVGRSGYIDVLEKRISSEQVKVIIGARRSGKSYIMRQLAKRMIEKKGADKNNILIVNFEDSRFTGLSLKLLQEIFDVYLETYKPKGEIYVFLDEIQEVPKWEKWVSEALPVRQAGLV
jgi:hypothetical protein